MIMNDSLHAQAEQLILTVLNTIQETGATIINPNKIAVEVDLIIDPRGNSPHLKTYLSVGHLKDITRRLLRKKLDPIEQAKEYFNGDTTDMFEGLLQQHYPAVRKIAGESTNVYVDIDELTPLEVARISISMGKAIVGLQKHKDAFDAYHISSSNHG